MQFGRSIRGALIVLSSLSLLAGCFDDVDEDGFTAARDQEFSAGGDQSNDGVAPVISGKPDRTSVTDELYAFQPKASDADGDSLEFRIENKPNWISFDRATGKLSGMPGERHVGEHGNIVVSVTDGTSVVSLPSFAITVMKVDSDGSSGGDGGSSDDGETSSDDGSGGTDSDPGTNTDADPGSDSGNGEETVEPSAPPTISGFPNTTAIVDTAYTFSPESRDPDGDELSFSIVNKPSWATFNTTTGRLSGTPTTADLGTHPGIEISVTDGDSIVAMPRFSITVETIGTTSMTLSWQAPTTNTDGTALTDLAGYRIYYGTASGDYTETIRIDTAGITTYVIDNLVRGTYYVAMTSVNAAGVESERSAEAAFELN